MIRFGKALVLIAICATLCQCSSRPEAIRTGLRQQPPVKDAGVPELPVARRGIEPAAPNNLDDVTGSTGRADIRPWPRRGTPEMDQLQAEEIAREQRIKEVLSGICRRC